ncbi:hypothetical protein KTD31_00285 [Burkholderia multivorans]|uniref:hypothetical protein n=1 Tax=Burkholderia multivorans TaxID=87883 RepID=UPI001C245FDB|nr:hypothetical protein [Burkholderia multivorans]MBU9199836.1 hypothetical protein [Burkholderia multivorans]MDN8079045.1 hypothetical protein [Burkholderia multivorans]
MTEAALIEAAPKKLSRGEIIENQAARYEAAKRVIEDEGIRIKHFRLKVGAGGEFFGAHKGGITVAYRQLRTDTFVELSTALCSINDVYNRKVGTVVAVEQFANLHRIRLPLFGADVDEVVEALFEGYTTFDVDA